MVIGQGTVLGRPQQIDARSRTPRQPAGASTTIGDGCLIGSATIVAAGARVGARAHLGDHVMLREGALIGEEVMIGRGGGVAHDAWIGDRTRLQGDCLVGNRTVIDEDVMISARVSFIGDPSLGRGGPPGRGIRVRRAARIGVSAIIFPPVTIGEEALVGAAAVVRDDVPSRTVVAGTPAVPMRAVRDDELLEAYEQTLGRRLSG